MEANQQLELLEAILNETREQRLSWEEDDEGGFVASGTIPARIQLKYPMLGDETVSGADLAAVTVPGVEMAFFSGTEGMRVVQKILMAGLPEWDDHISKIDNKLKRLIDQLEGNTQS